MRLMTANGVFFAVPHVAGFASWPCVLDPSSHQCPRPSPLVSQRYLTRKTPPRVTLLSTVPDVWSCSRKGRLRGNKSRKRACGMTALPTSTASTVSSASSPTITARTPPASLGLSIVGMNASEIGFLIAERFNYPVKSMGELMEGKRGRKTDMVKVKAILQWLQDNQVSGGILTGFPETVAQAQLLRDQGVKINSSLILHQAVTRPTGGNMDGKSMQEHNVDCVTSVEGVEHEQYSEVARYIELHGGNLVEVCHGQDVQGTCDTAARELDLASWRTSSDDRAAGALSTKANSSPGASDNVSCEEDALQQNYPGIVDQATVSEAPQEESPASRLAMMSPSERMRAQEFDLQACKAAARASKEGAEIKRLKKQIISEKKRAANEAQRVDTPFYLAVADGNRKSRAHPPVVAIPSRVTENISSVERGRASAGNRRIDFGPIVLDSPASDCLLAAGISKPTGIQLAAMGPVLDGESVILHAMTGSGKTLAFLLPLMKRWAGSFVSSGAPDGIRQAGGAGRGDLPFRVLIALPTRELAVQVARETVLLSGGATASVELLVDPDEPCDLGRVAAPIVVGSAKVLERIIRQAPSRVRSDVLSRIECIVVDEVDRVVDVLPKHAPPREVEKRKKHARPIATVLERVLECKPHVQVVGCSATIGRPLRRHLAHIINTAVARRAATAGKPARARDDNAGQTELREAEFRVIRDPFLNASGPLSTERAVPIPETIKHFYVTLLDGEFFSRLEALAAAVRELQPRRPLIFVPPDERVTGVVAHLRREGGEVGKRAVALHEAMGFGPADVEQGVRGKHSSEAILQHDKLTGMFRGASLRSMSDAGHQGGAGGSDGSDDAGGPEDRECGAVLVTSEDTARGLHFDDVDYVFLMQKPKGPDEYVHLAGRTGRQGKGGFVVSLVTFSEKRKMQSLSATLKFQLRELNLRAEDGLE